MKPLGSRWFGWSAIMTAGLMLANSYTSASAEDVDLELLLAVDVSPSVDAEEYVLQMRGLADAVRHPDVVDAIRSAAPRGVAVALMQWGGPREQNVSVPWTAVRDEATASAFAERIETVTRPTTSGGTAIGDALGRGVSVLAENNFRGLRQVIDVSGDGRTNQGDSPAPIRAHAVSLGITVNGLVIIDEDPQLIGYYLERVIGGPGSFVLQADDFEDFARAVRLKLIREIAGSMIASSSLSGRIDIVFLGPDAGDVK
jgi:hypothetical protein